VSDYLVKEIERIRNLRVRINTQVVDAYGERRLEGLLLRNGMSGSTERVLANGLFVMPLLLERSRPGVLAAGDVRHGAVQRSPPP
jgi:thioredoxin reductase (NADPH)